VWQTGKCLPEFGFLLHTQLSVAAPEQPLELGAVDGIGLRAVGKVNDTGPRDLGDRPRHGLGSRAARLVPVEQNRDVPGVGVRQELKLLDRDRGAHQRHGRDAQAMEADRAEVAADTSVLNTAKRFSTMQLSTRTCSLADDRPWLLLRNSTGLLEVPVPGDDIPGHQRAEPVRSG
jgi:hypothetical protein